MPDGRPIVTFDFDGVLCRPPFGINPGTNQDKVRRERSTKRLAHLTHLTEPYRYYLRRPMPGAAEGFRALAERYDCRVLTARTGRSRRLTEAWLRRWIGLVPTLDLREDWHETPAAYKVRRVQELGALAHFEDDPHTAAWVAEHVAAVFIVDWQRNRWLEDPKVHRIARLAEAVDPLARIAAGR
jgi:hypothetical protein